VYIGSCHLSADCSIRGTFLNKSFDISNDVLDDGTIGKAIELCLSEMFETFLNEKV